MTSLSSCSGSPEWAQGLSPLLRVVTSADGEILAIDRRMSPYLWPWWVQEKLDLWWPLPGLTVLDVEARRDEEEDKDRPVGGQEMLLLLLAPGSLLLPSRGLRSFSCSRSFSCCRSFSCWLTKEKWMKVTMNCSPFAPFTSPPVDTHSSHVSTIGLHLGHEYISHTNYVLHWFVCLFVIFSPV